MTSITQSTAVGKSYTPTPSLEGVRSGVAGAKPRSNDQRPRSGSLGNTEVNEQQQDKRSKILWGLQRTLWEVTAIPRLRGCHRWLAPGAGQTTVRWRVGEARWGGTQNSRSVWASPIAASRIAKLRTEEVKKAVETWFEQGKTHGVVFVTLTVRHHKGQSLQELWDAVTACWEGVTRTAAWRGGARAVGDKKRFGIEHFIKSVEVTYGENGWHVHIHALFLTNSRLSDDEREDLRSRVFSRWVRAAKRNGLSAPSVARGVRVDDAARRADSKKIGAYLAKGQMGSLAAEITGAISKKGRKESRTPFEILNALSREKTPQDLALWREWERVSSGRRQISWSRGAKKCLGVDDLDDAELLNKDDEEFDAASVDLVGIDAIDWHAETARGESLCDDVELRNQILKAARSATSRYEAISQVKQVLRDNSVNFRVLDSEVISRKGIELSREEIRHRRRQEARGILEIGQVKKVHCHGEQGTQLVLGQ